MTAARIVRIAKAIKELTYDETMEIAHPIMLGAVNRMKDGDPSFDIDNVDNWMDLIQSWATGAIES